MEITVSAFKLLWLELALCGLIVCMCLAVALVPRYRDSKQAVAENVQASSGQSATTSDQQKMIPSDRALTQKIRKAIHHDKSLSTNGRNIKIFAQDGKVILRGPVRSEEEKNNLQAKAMAAAGGAENVTNQLKVTIPK